MIRNVIILDMNGQSVFTENFGECHSFPNDTNMAEILSGFISALYSFSKNLSEQDVSEVNFGNLHLFITTRSNFIFVLAADDDKHDGNKTRLNDIAVLFIEQYYELIGESHDLDQSLVQDFSQILYKQNFIQNNCGDYENCLDCPNSSKSLPVKDLTQKLQNK
jgi:hypothetical protein